MRKKKKSLVGWAHESWKEDFGIGEYIETKMKKIYYPPIAIDKDDAFVCNKTTKVRITIEEIE